MTSTSQSPRPSCPPQQQRGAGWRGWLSLACVTGALLLFVLWKVSDRLIAEGWPGYARPAVLVTSLLMASLAVLFGAGEASRKDMANQGLGLFGMIVGLIYLVIVGGAAVIYALVGVGLRIVLSGAGS